MTQARSVNHKHRSGLREALPLAAILALAAVARLYGISVESLWLDEATSLMLARMDIPTLVEWTSLDIHPPLYYILLHYWIALGESEIALRSLSVLAGVLSVWVTYELGRVLFTRRVGLAAAALLALSPFHVWYSQEVRMYAWVTLWTSASVLLALVLWREPRWLAWVGYILAATAALYTHYYAVFPILLCNLFFVYLLMKRRLARRTAWMWAASQGGVFLLFLPWLPTFLLPITVGGGGWITMGMGRPSLQVLPQTAVLYMVGTARELYPKVVRRLAYLAYAGLFLLGLWVPRASAVNPSSPRKQSPWTPVEAGLFCLGYLALPLGIAWTISQIFKPMYSARYMLPFLIPFLLLVARGIGSIRGRAWRMIALGALLAVMGVGLVYQVRAIEKPDWRGLAASLVSEAHPDDLVLFMPGWHAKPFAYYAGDAIQTYSDVPIPIPRFREQAIRQVGEAIQGSPRVWFVWEEGHYADPDGVVYAYLQERLEAVDSRPLPKIGRVILFTKSQPGASRGLSQ